MRKREIFRNFVSMNTQRFLSLLVALLMVMAASITVNKSLFGHSFEARTDSSGPGNVGTEAIVVGDDGVATVNTSALPGTINGYAGPVPLEINIKDGKVISVEALDNTETPSFFKRAAVILSSWDGKTLAEVDSMEIDAVSGATFSSQAIINNFKVGLACYEGSDLHRNSKVPVKIWIALAVTLVACILPIFVRNKVYHTVQMIANVIVLGFWAGEFLDYSLILKYTSSGFTFPEVLIAGAMLIAAFLYPLFGRPQHYCLHICPLGSAQQLMAQVCGFKLRLSAKVLKAFDWGRRILWALLMLLLWTDCMTGWMDLELFQAFQFRSASIGIIITACFFVLLSAVISRPYCRFVCPTGSLFKRAENIG